MKRPRWIVFSLMLGMAILSGCDLTDRKVKNPLSAEKENPAQTGPAIRAAALDLVQAYRVNAARADVKYTDKRVAVTGRMIRVVGTAIVTSDGRRGTVYGLEM